MVSVALLGLWWPLRQRPGVGTVANAVIVGAVAGVLLTGLLLWGTVGVGSVVYALAIGPIIHRTIPALAARPEHGSRIMPVWEWISRPRRSQPSD